MPLGPPPATSSPLASLGLARWCAAGEGARCARGGQGGLSVPKAGGLPTRLRTLSSWQRGGPFLARESRVGLSAANAGTVAGLFCWND